jgi:hypothetical protein
VPPRPIAMPHIGAIVADARAEECGRPPFIAIGQNLEIGGERSVKAFHTAGFLGASAGRFRSSTRRMPVGGSSTGGARREAFPEPPAALREAARHRARVSVRRRLSARVARAIDRVRRSPALSPSAKAFDLSLEPRRSTTPTTPGGSVRVSARAASRRPARATSRSPPNTFRSALGHARARPSARR